MCTNVSRIHFGSGRPKWKKSKRILNTGHAKTFCYRYKNKFSKKIICFSVIFMYVKQRFFFICFYLCSRDLIRFVCEFSMILAGILLPESVSVFSKRIRIRNTGFNVNLVCNFQSTYVDSMTRLVSKYVCK